MAWPKQRLTVHFFFIFFTLSIRKGYVGDPAGRFSESLQTLPKREAAGSQLAYGLVSALLLTLQRVCIYMHQPTG